MSYCGIAYPCEVTNWLLIGTLCWKIRERKGVRQQLQSGETVNLSNWGRGGIFIKYVLLLHFGGNAYF